MASHDDTHTHTPPWVLAPDMKDYDELWLTCVFSKTSNPALPLPTYPNWVADADGTAVRYLGDHPYSTLHNPLTGATTSVSTVLDLKNNGKYTRPKGVLFGDGTILLYYEDRIEEEDDEGARATKFIAALLRPGNAAAWTVIERTLEASEYGKFCVAYHGGKILVSVGASQWHVVTPNDDVASDEEGSASAPKKMRWVRKDSLSLADRVMFLGWPNSFNLQ
ncbi:hypothetical protein ACQ4PT_047713 [Festuca glaucescens]